MTGAVKGVPDLMDLGAAGVATLTDRALRVSKKGWGDTFKQYAQERPFSTAVDKGLGAVASAIEGEPVTLQEHTPQTPLGRYADMGARGAATAIFGGAGAAARGFMSGVGSEVFGDVGQSVGGDTGQLVGNIAGGIAGGFAPEIKRAASGVAQSAASVAAPTLQPDMAALAKRAKDFDIPLSINQVDPTRVKETAQKVSQVIPFSGVGGFEQNQVSQWNRAFTRELGLDADKLSPDMVKTFLGNMDTGYADALKGTTIRMTSDKLAALDSIVKEAKMSLPNDAAKTIAQNVREVKSNMGNGFVRGEKANALRKQYMERASKASPELKDWIGQISAQLNDVIAEGLPAENAKAIRTLNKQYRNFKTAEPLLEKSKDGLIDPVMLNQRVASSPYIKKSRLEIGEDSLADLARIGQMLPKLRGSDTFEKQVYGAATGVAGMGGAGVGTAIDPASTMLAVGANRGFQKLYNQSPKVLDKAIKKTLTREERKAAFEAAKLKGKQ